MTKPVGQLAYGYSVRSTYSSFEFGMLVDPFQTNQGSVQGSDSACVLRSGGKTAR